MKYILKSSILVFLSLGILSCGDATTSGALNTNIGVSSTKSLLDSSQKQMSVDFLLTNNYTKDIEVKVQGFNLEILPCDIDNVVFTPSEINFDENQKSILRAELSFINECTPKSYQLTGNTLVTLEGETKEISLKSSYKDLNTTIITVETNSETNTTSSSTGPNLLTITTANNDFSLGIPNVQKKLLIDIKNALGNSVNPKDIKKVTVTSENELLVKVWNTETLQSEKSVVLPSDNFNEFTIVSTKLSGIAPIRVVVDLIDINKKEKQLSKLINVSVRSGSPSAISISYVGTSQDESRAKYEEKFAVSVTDEYGNRVNTRPYISLGAIVGYAVDGRESSNVESALTQRLYYGQSAIQGNTANGRVDPLGDGVANTTHFEDTTPSRSNVFQWVNAEGKNSDKLVVFGKGKNYEAMGKWDFSKIDNNTLKLEDDYYGEFRSDLSYAVGRNYYQDQCTDDSREWVGTTDSETYQLDEEGTVIVSYKYDYHLTGKDALVWVNLTGYQSDTQKNTRLGEVVKHTLRGVGLESRPSAGYSVDANTTAIVQFDIHHMNAPEWYRNAHFGYDIPSTKCAVSVIDTSNIHDARSCTNGGVAYITFKVSSPEDSDCNFNINNILVADEF